jgi:hypothetical protein
VDRLARLRAPLAVAALAALTLVALARVGAGLSELGPSGSRAVAAARFAPNASDGALTLLAGFLVLCCFAVPEVRVRRSLAVWGAALTAVSLVATVVALALTSAEVAGWSLVWLIPEVALPVVVGAALLTLARPEPRTHGTGAAEEAPTTIASPDPAPDPEPDPELEPGWASDSAAGAVWRTAGEAARGAPASGWGQGSGGSTDAGTGWGAGPGGAVEQGVEQGAEQGAEPGSAWGRPPELPPAARDPRDR